MEQEENIEMVESLTFHPLVDRMLRRLRLIEVGVFPPNLEMVVGIDKGDIVCCDLLARYREVGRLNPLGPLSHVWHPTPARELRPVHVFSKVQLSSPFVHSY